MGGAEVRRATVQERRVQIGENEQVEEGWEWLDCCGFDYICDRCLGTEQKTETTEQNTARHGRNTA